MIQKLIAGIQSARRGQPAFIFAIFSSSLLFSLLLVFPFYDQVLRYKPAINNFSDHMISDAVAANIDISLRISSYLLFVLGFSLLTLIFFIALYCLFNQSAQKENNARAISFVRDTSLIGIAVVIVSIFTVGKDIAGYFIGGAVLSGWIFISLKDKAKDFDVLVWAMLAAVPFALFIAQFSRVFEFVPHFLNIFLQPLDKNLTQQMPQVALKIVFICAWVIMSIVFFRVLPGFVKQAFKSSNNPSHTCKSIIIMCGIPFLFTGIVQSLLFELLNILNKNFSIVVGHPYLIYILVMLVAAVIAALIWLQFKFVILKKLKIVPDRAGNLIYTLYMPIILLTLACLLAQPARMVGAGKEFFEMANHGIAIDHLFRYGSIPIIDTFDAHGITNQLFAYFYSLFNGYEPWAAFLYSNYSWVLYLVPAFYILKKLVGPVNSFFMILCFPLLTSLISPYYLLSGLVALCIIRMISSRKMADYFLFWITAFLLGIYRFDLGTAAVIGGLVTFIIAAIALKEKIAYGRFFLAGVISGGVLLVLFSLLCIIKGISPLDRILDIISLGKGNLGGAYTTTGDSNQMVYILCYYILPLFVVTSALWLVIRVVIKNRYTNSPTGENPSKSLNTDVFILFLFFTVFFIINAQRGIVRHSFLENLVVFILGTIPLAILALSVIVQNMNTNMPRFLSAALIIVLLINLNSTSFKGLGSSALSSAVVSPAYAEQYAETYAFKGTRVKGPVMPADAESLKSILDSLLTSQETYFDYSSINYYYALVGRKNPVYINQSPLLIQTDRIQKNTLQEFKKVRPPLALVPILGKYGSFWDNIPVDYKYYMLAEYIYENYEPLIRLPLFDVYCLKEKRSGFVNRLKENGVTGRTGVQLIDDKPEVMVCDLGQIPRLWAEKDGNRVFSTAARLAVQEKDVKFLTADISTIPPNQPMYLLLQIESPRDAAAAVDINNGQNKLAEYKFMISRGSHFYVVRVSTDFHWWNDTGNNVSLVIDQPVTISRLCFISAESSAIYSVPLSANNIISRKEGNSRRDIDIISDRPMKSHILRN